jgi:hypothetical protein
MFLATGARNSPTARARLPILRFPGESHGMSTTGWPDHRVARLTATLDWLAGHPA